jgi:Arc/MetJ-type ribon-helix-helix transcriptional regulator
LQHPYDEIPADARSGRRVGTRHTRIDGTIGNNTVDIVAAMTASISITLDDELAHALDAAVAGGNRSAVVAEAIREYLDRHTIAAAQAWHASLTGEDAATLRDFDAAW